ncbi:hypothetical protein [Methylocucumis oryzae]|uniref:DUF4426 domain-containing protein n=1 Tax=Methylocucumis oryzae TaxID=1632867 RepID=A0A0F3IIN4_9GAMM|nr:hypothetical protein [Methylocucumis oryzae]KJV05359.1 hypothetical protein VZ94_18725 [Methylocucumis oryzae]
MKQHIVLSLFIAASVVPNIGSAASASEQQQQLRIHTGVPKKTGDLLFSYTTEWQKAGADPFRVTSISFINNSKLTGDNPAAQVSKKLVTAFKDSMTQVDPGARGAVVSQKDQEPAFTISNRAGFSLNWITVRDYTNQSMSYDLVDKTFW